MQKKSWGGGPVKGGEGPVGWRGRSGGGERRIEVIVKIEKNK